jgi:hypothetical protein
MKIIQGLLFSALLSQTPAQAQLFDQRPDVLVCSVSQSTTNDAWLEFVYYVSGTQKGGITLYKSLTSNPVLVKVDKAGNISVPNLADCDGKNVKDLLKNGRAAYFSSP